MKKTRTVRPAGLSPEQIAEREQTTKLVRGRIAPFKPPAKKKVKKARDDDAGDDEGEGDTGASSSTDEDPGKPAFKVGYAKLVISQAGKKLKVDLRSQLVR